MAKRCKHGNCKAPVFSHNYCKIHQRDRTDEKWIATKDKIKPRKRTHVKVDPKYKDIDIICSTKVGRVSEILCTLTELYKQLWDTRPHVSFLSDIEINIPEGSDWWFNIFAHVLAKALNKYPKYKLYAPNIIFLTPEEHRLLDFGTNEQRLKYAEEHNCSWNKIYNLAEELKSSYPNILNQ
jgi:hypothetical protein